MIAIKNRGLADLGMELLQDTAMTYVYRLLAAQAINNGNNIFGCNGTARFVQRSFLEKVKDGIKADTEVDSILLKYQEAVNNFGQYPMKKKKIFEIPNTKSRLRLEPKSVTVSSIPIASPHMNSKPMASVLPLLSVVGLVTLVSLNG